MIDVKPFGAVFVKNVNLIEISPDWSVVFYMMMSVVFFSRAIWVSRPFMPAFSVERIFVFLVYCGFKGFPSLIILGVFNSLFAFPRVLIVRIFAKVFWRSDFQINLGAFFAQIRNRFEFFIIFVTRLVYQTSGTNFKLKRFFSWLHNSDIIAHVEGDLKQGENGENPDRTIPCQASAFKRALEGVTTRGRAKAVIPPRAPCLVQNTSDEIVCSAWEHAGASDKEPRTLTSRTTIENRSRKAQDNLTNNNALLNRLKTRGNVKTISGGSTVMQEFFYNDPATQYAASFSGFDTISVAVDSPISGATFNIKHYADSVAISGPEMLANNDKEQMIDLLATRVEIAEARLQNKIDVDLHGNESGNSGKNLAGLADMLTTGTPGRIATGTYGNIGRGTVGTFWQHLYGTGTSTVGAATTSSTIQKAFNAMILPLVRGSDAPDLIYCGSTTYQQFLESLQAIQRITSDGSENAAAGFTGLKYYGSGKASDVVLGGGIGGNATAGYAYFLNTKYLFLRPHKERNFVPIGGDRQSVNQDAVVRLFGWSGALTCSGLQFQGLLNATV